MNAASPSVPNATPAAARGCTTQAAFARTAGSLVVKAGVHLGGLTDADRQLALGLVWCGLPDRVLTERAVNDRLRDLLDGWCGFLTADHVELRRWLVDGGWLQRDGWGRAYQRVPPTALPPDLLPMADWLLSHDTPAWACSQREQAAATRAARRAAWLAHAATTPGPAA